MEDSNKLPIKMVEISLQRFNDEAIPHHLNVLKQHKNNIIKYQESGELNKIKHEHMNAKRQLTQLKNLLKDMEDLRTKVQLQDLAKFDSLTQHSRKKTLQAIIEYLDNPPSIEIPKRVDRTTPSTIHSSASTDSIGTLVPSNLQLVIDKDGFDLRAKEECLKSWEELNSEVQDLFEIFTKFQQTIDNQGAAVDAVANHVEVAAVDVDAGRRTLSRAEKYKLTAYPIAGAVIGGCLAGPLGLLAGVKVAGAALVGGGILGFTGANLLKKKRDRELTTAREAADKKDL